MKRSKVSLVALAAASALLFTACSSTDGGNAGGGGSGDNPTVVENPTFEAGTTMEKLAKAEIGRAHV